MLRPELEKRRRIKICKLISIPDDASDALYSIFRFKPRRHGFKLALYLISGGLEEMPVLSTPQHDEIIVEARDGTEDQVQAIVRESMEEAFRADHPRGPVCGEIRDRPANSWGDEIR